MSDESHTIGSHPHSTRLGYPMRRSRSCAESPMPSSVRWLAPTGRSRSRTRRRRRCPRSRGRRRPGRLTGWRSGSSICPEARYEAKRLRERASPSGSPKAPAAMGAAVHPRQSWWLDTIIGSPSSLRSTQCLLGRCPVRRRPTRPRSSSVRFRSPPPRFSSASDLSAAARIAGGATGCSPPSITSAR